MINEAQKDMHLYPIQIQQEDTKWIQGYMRGFNFMLVIYLRSLDHEFMARKVLFSLTHWPLPLSTFAPNPGSHQQVDSKVGQA